MRKKTFVFVLFFVLFFVSASPEEFLTEAGGKVKDVGENTGFYAEILGQNLLKFQEFFMGIVQFITLGFSNVGGDMAFPFFMFFILFFMVIYGVIGFFLKKFTFWISFIITLLAFIGMDENSLRIIFSSYESMGLTLTVILPVLILLAFTFRIYQKAYEGKSGTSPFYAEVFNLLFLVFFGVFFIRHAGTEEGFISVARYISGVVLIVLGFSQVVFYKLLARMISRWIKDNEKFKKDLKKMDEEYFKEVVHSFGGVGRT